MSSWINLPAAEDTLTAELHEDGLLEVSDTDSNVIAGATRIANGAQAREALIRLLGEVGRQLPIRPAGMGF
jgi:hypothetical protein